MSESWIWIETLKQTPHGQTDLVMHPLSQKKAVRKSVPIDAPSVVLDALRREKDVLEKLDSMWTPSLVEYGSDLYAHTLVETWFEGCSLEEWLHERPSRKAKKEIFLQILALIEQVHQAGYLYLDLKGDNVLVHNGHAVLIDFNACLPIGSTRPVFVNKDALPPEGADGARMDERADQIGLGRLYLHMFGPSLIAWTALSTDPRRRFSSLKAMKKAVKKSRKKSALLILSLFLVACCSVLMLVLPIGTSSQAGENERLAYALDSSNGLPEASVLCAQYARLLEENPQRKLSPAEWSVAAKAALREEHRSLAGFCMDHLPDDTKYSIRFSKAMLELLVYGLIPQKQLDDLLEELPDQSGWQEPLELMAQMVALTPDAVAPDRLERLLAEIETPEQMSGECARSLVYMLIGKRQNGQTLSLNETMQNALAKRAPDLWKLYLHWQSADSDDAASIEEIQKEDLFSDFPLVTNSALETDRQEDEKNNSFLWKLSDDFSSLE